ncbi:hypothetical protein [Paraliobacillus sp. JSM ZJ581]|uniref:hypothetical protein n=1 Tax=Paraliobacillus sp. JSM ZJ581 TaxID=3342118 RepID=UPI0035A897B2
MRKKWAAMTLESVEHISTVIDNMSVEDRPHSYLSAEELAWTILSLENGVALFYFIAKVNVPINLYGKHYKTS